jgi:hypothetical protein
VLLAPRVERRHVEDPLHEAPAVEQRVVDHDEREEEPDGKTGDHAHHLAGLRLESGLRSGQPLLDHGARER